MWPHMLHIDIGWWLGVEISLASARALQQMRSRENLPMLVFPLPFSHTVRSQLLEFSVGFSVVIQCHPEWWYSHVDYSSRSLVSTALLSCDLSQPDAGGGVRVSLVVFWDNFLHPILSSFLGRLQFCFSFLSDLVVLEKFSHDKRKFSSFSENLIAKISKSVHKFFA